MKKTFSVVTSVMLTLMMLFVSCEQGTPPALQTGPNDLVSVSFTKVEAKSINVDGIGTVTTPELSELYFQYKAVKTAGEGASAVQGEKTEWTDLGAKGLSQTIQLSRGNWTISLRGFATDALRTAAGTAETASTQAVFEGSLSQDIGSNLTSRNESVNVSLDFTNPDGMGTYVIEVTVPAEYASQQVKVKVTVTPASGDAQVQTHQFDEGTVSHTYSFAGLNNGIATVKLEYMDSRDMEIGDPASSSILVMTDMTTNGSATVAEDNTFTVSFEGTSVNGTAEGKYVPTTFTSLFEIYPDTIANNEIVVGYAYETKALDVTPISFPVEILTGDAVKDENGRYKASELGLIPVTVTRSSDLNASGATEAWWGKTASVGYSAPENTTLASVRFVDGVSSIGYYAFSGCTGLTSITIPEGVTSIGNSAFKGCTGLTSITIPDGVTSIGDEAFKSCTGLTSITIPDGVTSIGGSAFHDCSGLTEVTYGGTIEQWHAIGYDLPRTADVTCSDGKAVFRLQKIKNSDAVYVNGLTPYGKANYTEIVIPEGVTNIESHAFSGCTGLTSITIPEGVTSIGNNAFNNCTGLTSVTIPSSVTSMGTCPFSGCTSVAEVTYGGTIEQWYAFRYDLSSIADVACQDGKAVFRFQKNIFDGTVSVNGLTPYGKANCTEIIIPEGITSIGYNAFNGCASLTSVTIPSSVTAIGSSVFWECTGLTSITIPENVTTIGNNVFYNCTGLTDIYVNQQESTLLDNANVPEGCNIHWNSTGSESV